VMAIIMSAFMLTLTYALFSRRFGYNLLPSNPLGAFAVSALSGTFMMSLAILLVIVVVNYLGVRNIGFVGFLPLILSYLLGFGQIYANLPTWFVYLSPFNSIASLLYNTYDGSPIHAQVINQTSVTLNWFELLVSILSWVVTLSVVDTYLLSRIKPRAIEEARQV
jgi:hypothetical protein